MIPYTVDRRADTGVTNVTMGIWLFLASEAMLFGALFSSYALIRTAAASWPSGREIFNLLRQHRAALEGRRPVRDGEIVTACQQSCPAEAIVFGNIRDPNSRVAQAVASERTYRVLDELINTQPAVSYLEKVTFHEVAAAEG